MPFDFSALARGQARSQVKEFEERAGTLLTARGAKSEMARQAIARLPDRFSIRELLHVCSGVSRPMIRVILEAMREEGKLKALGTGRGAMWQKT